MLRIAAARAIAILIFSRLGIARVGPSDLSKYADTFEKHSPAASENASDVHFQGSDRRSKARNPWGRSRQVRIDNHWTDQRGGSARDDESGIGCDRILAATRQQLQEPLTRESGCPHVGVDDVQTDFVVLG